MGRLRRPPDAFLCLFCPQHQECCCRAPQAHSHTQRAEDEIRFRGRRKTFDTEESRRERWSLLLLSSIKFSPNVGWDGMAAIFKGFASGPSHSPPSFLASATADVICMSDHLAWGASTSNLCHWSVRHHHTVYVTNSFQVIAGPPGQKKTRLL